MGSERPEPRPRARARGGEGETRAGSSSASPGGRRVGLRVRGLPGSSGRADVSLGVRFLLLGLGATSRPRGGGEGARTAPAAQCFPCIQDTLGLVAGSGGGGFLRSGDGERDRPPASPRTRAGRASRRATRAYRAPPGPSTLDADLSLSEDAGRGAASSEDAGVVTGAGDGPCASAGGLATSRSRLSVAASDKGKMEVVMVTRKSLKHPASRRKSSPSLLLPPYPRWCVVALAFKHAWRIYSTNHKSSS